MNKQLFNLKYLGVFLILLFIFGFSTQAFLLTKATNSTLPEETIGIVFEGIPLSPVEHPFYIFPEEEQYSQEFGDGVCLNRWLEHPSPQIESSSGTRLPYKYAYDGIEISAQWHVWYHREGGFCVANK